MAAECWYVMNCIMPNTPGITQFHAKSNLHQNEGTKLNNQCFYCSRLNLVKGMMRNELGILRPSQPPGVPLIKQSRLLLLAGHPLTLTTHLDIQTPAKSQPRSIMCIRIVYNVHRLQVLQENHQQEK